MSRPNLRIIEPDETDELRQLKQELAELKARIDRKHESATEIAARIRSGIGPTRPMIVRELVRRENERWI